MLLEIKNKKVIASSINSNDFQILATSKIHIKVSDTNDNPPIFTQPVQYDVTKQNIVTSLNLDYTSWPADAPRRPSADEIFHKVEARDADSGENSTVNFSRLFYCDVTQVAAAFELALPLQEHANNFC